MFLHNPRNKKQNARYHASKRLYVRIVLHTDVNARTTLRNKQIPKSFRHINKTMIVMDREGTEPEGSTNLVRIE